MVRKGSGGKFYELLSLSLNPPFLPPPPVKTLRIREILVKRREEIWGILYISQEDKSRKFIKGN